jgi:hypothetical protein
MEAGGSMVQDESREHQVVWVSPSTWVNEVTVTSLHQFESYTFGYCKIGAVTWLVQQNNTDRPIWVIVGWVRMN